MGWCWAGVGGVVGSLRVVLGVLRLVFGWCWGGSDVQVEQMEAFIQVQV